MATERLGFSTWGADDLPLAQALWRDPAVTRLICANGRFSDADVEARLQTELFNQREHGVQYWPIFELTSGELVGCCGLRPFEPGAFELGFHLRPTYWGRGLATEAARTVIEHTFSELGAERLIAGHHPQNLASRHVLEKLGFTHIGQNLYPPTGLMHPSYELYCAQTTRRRILGRSARCLPPRRSLP